MQRQLIRSPPVPFHLHVIGSAHLVASYPSIVAGGEGTVGNNWLLQVIFDSAPPDPRPFSLYSLLLHVMLTCGTAGRPQP